MKRNTYHTTIKIAHALDIQNQWLPKQFLEGIPRSTAHAWKSEYIEKFVGYEFASDLGSNVDELKLMYNRMVMREKRIFMAYVRIKLTLVNIIGKDQWKDVIKQNFKVIYNLMLTVHSSLGVSINQLAGFLGLTPQRFQYLKRTAIYHCTNSATGLCVKQVPGQASVSEIQTMGKMLRRRKLAHWPIASIWALAVRKNLTKLSLSAWYRYNKRFDFRSTKKKLKHHKEYEPLRASRPNEIWHADITIFKTMDRVKHYVYLIVDNYSKFILNWTVFSSANGKIRTDTLRQAIKQEFGDDLSSKTKAIDLIVDGGTENNNQTIEQYIKASHVDIDKKIALRDIEQSNSMVEASNKILKHRYLYRKNVQDYQELIEHLNEAVFEFNFQRPHYSLELFTPAEVHYNKRPNIKKEAIRHYVKERILQNKANPCTKKC